MTDLCRIVPVLALGGLLAGCWQVHDLRGDRCTIPPGFVCCGPGDAPRPGRTVGECPFACPAPERLAPVGECAPRRFDAGVIDGGFLPLPDAGPDAARPDAARPDAGPLPNLTCQPRRATAACSDLSGLIVVRGMEAGFAYRFDDCGCCPQTECVASVDAASRRVLFTTTLCPDECDCDDCGLIEGRCVIPPLPFAGEWEAWVNDAPAFHIPVREALGGEPNPAGCSTFAAPNSCSSASPLGARPWQPTETCVRERSDRRTLELVHTCGSCDYPGPCISYVSGDVIVVEPSRFASPCDLCDDSCRRTVMTCELPPLPSSDREYTVVIDGAPVATVGTGALRELSTTCAP